jgi:NADPH-dependent 2,4-dienoyl-CoA reductase/sulfur reductase-like enzyme
MIEEGARITARRPADLVARALWGVRVLTRTRLSSIRGIDRVEAVEIERDGVRSELSCDGVIFTGRFTPEAALIRASHLAFDERTGGPVIDSAWRCSDPTYFAAGNVIRAVEHSGWAAAEGRSAARAVLEALDGRLPDRAALIPVSADGALRYVYPQKVLPGTERVTLFARAARPQRGKLRLMADGEVVSSRTISALPERRLVLNLSGERLRGRRALTVALD